MKVNNYIILDFNKTKQVDVQTIHCDMNSRFVRVNLRHNNSPIDLSDVRVCIMAVKPDGKEIFNDCTVIDAQNGLAEFEITKQMGIVVGEVKCQIKLFGKEKLLSSNIFNLSVSKSLSPNSRDSKDQLNTLVESLNRVDEWDDQFQQKYNGLEEEYAHDITEIKGLVVENNLVGRMSEAEQELTQTNAQLSDVFLQLENTAKSVVKVKTNADSANQLKGCVTFIDDDGVIEVKTLLKPLFDKYNKKFSIAIPTSQIGTSGRLTWDDVRELRDGGIDILSHGHSHNVFGDMTRDQQVYDIEQSKIVGMNNGIIFNDIVYPGNRPGNVKDIILKYFRSGIGLNGSTYNNAPVTTREMRRVELGSWQTKTTEEIKSLIDTVKQNGKWLILMTHCSVTGSNAHADGNMNTIETILKYCCDNNLDVLTYDDAYRKHCNVLEVGDWGNTNQNYVVMGSDYIVRSYNKDFLNSINRIKYKDLPIYTLPNAISVDENIVYTKITSSTASSAGVPLNLAGMLKTEKFGTGAYVGYTKQSYSIHNSFRRFYRYCNDNGAWSQWFEDTPFDWKCQSIDYDSSCNVKCTSTIDASGRSLLFITSPADTGDNIIKWITPSKAAQIIVLINKLDADVTLRQGISGANLHFKTDGDYVLKKYRSISFINVSGELVEI